MEEFRSWNKKYNVVCVIIKFYVISSPLLFIVYCSSKIGQDIVDGLCLIKQQKSIAQLIFTFGPILKRF